MTDNIIYVTFFVIINLINFISYNYLEYKYKVKEKILDLIFNPFYSIWIRIYLYNKEKNGYVSKIVKMFFFLSYWFFWLIFLKVMIKELFLLPFVLFIIIIQFINIYIINKYFEKKKMKINFNKIDYTMPAYIIDIKYYIFISDYKDNNRIINWIKISKTLFNFYSVFLFFIVYFIINILICT